MNDCVKENRPEFVELLDALKEQLSYMDENSSIIFEKVNTIKDVREPEKEELKEPNSGGLMNELWLCVARMKKYNNTLNQSKKALVRFIG
jgi:hypothetical protein